MIGTLARFCQFIGLVLLPAALFIGMANHDSRTELLLLICGAAIFTLGHYLGKGGKGSAT